MTTPPLCPLCEQDELREMRIIPTGDLIHLCPECDATWPEGADLSADDFGDLSTFLADRGISGGWECVELLNPPPVKTTEQKILDIRAKKPRRELRARITEHGGDPAVLSWVDAMEYDSLLAAGSPDELGFKSLRTINRSHDTHIWQTVQPFDEIGRILDTGADPGDELYVHFHSLHRWGVARMLRLHFGSSAIPFALAAEDFVSFAAPDLTSWLGVDTEESERGALVTAEGDYWRPRLGRDPHGVLASWRDRSFEIYGATVTLE